MLAKGSLTIKGNSAVIDTALDSGPGSARMTDFRGRDVLAGYSSIASLGWVVIASTDAADALAPAYAQARFSLLAETVGALLMIAFAVILTRFTIRPILALARAAAKVEAGDLTVRVRLDGGTEVRHLGAAFNAMVDAARQCDVQASRGGHRVRYEPLRGGRAARLGDFRTDDGGHCDLGQHGRGRAQLRGRL